MRVVVTGASSGIGYQLALQLVRAGAKVLVTARRKERLEQLIAESLVGADHRIGRIDALPGDLTDPSHRAAIADWCNREWGGIDTLVHNAGAGAIAMKAELLTGICAVLLAIAPCNAATTTVTPAASSVQTIAVDYPIRALREGRQGTVIIALTVGPGWQAEILRYCEQQRPCRSGSRRMHKCRACNGLSALG